MMSPPAHQSAAIQIKTNEHSLCQTEDRSHLVSQIVAEEVRVQLFQFLERGGDLTQAVTVGQISLVKVLVAGSGCPESLA